MEFSKPATFSVGARPVLTTQNADMELDSGDQEIITLAQGLIGYSDGATKAKVGGTFPVPAAGLEYNFPAIMVAKTTIDIGFLFGNVTYRIRGRILTCKLTSDPSKPAELTLTFGGYVLGIS